MKKFITNTTNKDPAPKEAIDFDSLSNPNSFPAETKELSGDYSLNFSATDKRTSSQNGIPEDPTIIWKNSVGEPENNALKITLVRF